MKKRLLLGGLAGYVLTWLGGLYVMAGIALSDPLDWVGYIQGCMVFGLLAAYAGAMLAGMTGD